MEWGRHAGRHTYRIIRIRNNPNHIYTYVYVYVCACVFVLLLFSTFPDLTVVTFLCYVS